MTVLRLFGIIVVLIGMAVAVKGGMLPFGGGTNSAGRSPLQQQIDQATFTGAEASLDAFHAGTATYVGAPAISGVTVVRADANSYCLQARAGTTVEHMIGPGGSVLVGPC
jgi:hypothetical protein